MDVLTELVHDAPVVQRKVLAVRWVVLALLSGCALKVPDRRDGGARDADVVTDRDDLGAEVSPDVLDVVDAPDVLDVGEGDRGGDVTDVDDLARGEASVDADVIEDAGPRCDAGQTLCDGRCVDTSSDPAHCGGCGMACVAPGGGSVVCGDGGACVPRCPSGQALVGGACLFDSPPRPLGPLSTSLSTGRRPVFRWGAAPRTTHTCIELCADRACARALRDPEVVRNATDDAGGPRVVRFQPSAPVLAAVGTPRVVYWRLYGCNDMGAAVTVRSATWQLYLPRTTNTHEENLTTVSAWGVATDFNGDGLGDIAVSAIPEGRLEGGRVYVHPGRLEETVAPALVLAPPRNPEGAFYENYGETVTSVGDLDGDGFGDLAVAACNTTNAAVSGLFLYRGRADVFAPSAPWEPWRTITDGMLAGVGCSAIAAAGDVDGDGHGDILAVHRRGELRLLRWSDLDRFMASSVFTPNDSVGTGAAGVGDLDDDGLGEFVVSRPALGQVHVYRGDATFPRSTAPWQAFPGGDGGVGRPTTEMFGNVLAAAGDHDGDGRPDVVIAETTRNAFSVWSWTPAARSFTRINERMRTGSGWGRAVAANDIDGDGRSDVLVALADGVDIAYTGPRGNELLQPPATDGGSRTFLVRATVDANGDGLFDPMVSARFSNAAWIYYALTGTSRLQPRPIPVPATGGFGWWIAALRTRHRAVF